MSETRDMIPADEVESILAERVRAEVEKAVAGIKDMVSAQLQAPVAVAPSEDQNWMQALAMQIATLTDQDIGRKRVPPEEMVKREKAKERMVGLIAEADARGEEPLYRLRSVVYLGEQKIMPSWIDPNHRQQPTEIGWMGVPNMAMEPVNEVAQRIYSAFAEWTGGVDRKAAKAAGVEVETGRLTPSGLISVRQGEMTKRFSEAQHTGVDTSGRGSLIPTIRGRGGPGQTVERRILGTVMPPAREMP